MQETQLVEWNRIKAEIANCKDVSVMSKMNYSLEAIQKWARQSKQSLETQNEIAEYRLRLNRKQGEWIEQNIPEEGGNPQLTKNSQLTLAEAGIDRNDSPKFRILAKIPEDKFENYIRESKESVAEITTNDACRLLNKPHVANNSGENEWYTPPEYIEAARRVMGSIDTDPASSDEANEIIKAKKYYTSKDDGLSQTWVGNIWMNTPYAQPLVAQISESLASKYETREVKQACVLVNNATETEWFQKMMNLCDAVCFLKGRVKFIDKNGESTGAPLQGQAIVYLGKNKKAFAAEFGTMGKILYA